MLTANDLRSYILDGLPSDHVEVRGDDGQHFEAVIVSPPDFDVVAWQAIQDVASQVNCCQHWSLSI